MYCICIRLIVLTLINNCLIIGTDSSESIHKMKALSSGARPSGAKQNYHRLLSSQSYVPSPPQTPSMISCSPSSVKSCPSNTRYGTSVSPSHRRRLCRSNRELYPALTKELGQTSRFAPVPSGDYFNFRSENAIITLITFTKCSHSPFSGIY